MYTYTGRRDRPRRRRCRRGCRRAATRRWAERLKDPAIRARVDARDATPTERVGEPASRRPGRRSRSLLVGFKNDTLKPLTGKTLAEVARMRGKSPEETAMDLVIEDGSRVGTVYFLMSRGERPAADHAAVGELRLRRGVAGAEGRVPQVEPAPARLRQLRARCSARTCATRRSLPLEERSAG